MPLEPAEPSIVIFFMIIEVSNGKPPSSEVKVVLVVVGFAVGAAVAFVEYTKLWVTLVFDVVAIVVFAVVIVGATMVETTAVVIVVGKVNCVLCGSIVAAAVVVLVPIVVVSGIVVAVASMINGSVAVPVFAVES
jgi:hypothetical protein